MMRFTVDFYKLPDGSCPIQNFPDSLDNKMRAKLLRLVLYRKDYLQRKESL